MLICFQNEQYSSHIDIFKQCVDAHRTVSWFVPSFPRTPSSRDLSSLTFQVDRNHRHLQSHLVQFSKNQQVNFTANCNRQSVVCACIHNGMPFTTNRCCYLHSVEGPGEHNVKGIGKKTRQTLDGISFICGL